MILPFAAERRHSNKAANLLIRQFQNTVQNQNTLLLGGQTGKGIRHKLIVDILSLGYLSTV